MSEPAEPNKGSSFSENEIDNRSKRATQRRLAQPLPSSRRRSSGPGWAQRLENQLGRLDGYVRSQEVLLLSLDRRIRSLVELLESVESVLRTGPRWAGEDPDFEYLEPQPSEGGSSYHDD